MRGFGIAFIVVAGVGPFVPFPIAMMMVAYVAVAGLIATATAVSEYRERVWVGRAAETQEARAWFQEMRDLDVEVEAEWDDFVPGSTRPLGARNIPTGRIRTLRTSVPIQRQPGRAS